MKVIAINDLSEEGVSHNPEIRKKVIIKKGEIPHLTNYSQSCFSPGQVADKHVHNDMYEVFHVVSGHCEVEIEKRTFELKNDECIIIYPNERHLIRNTGSYDLILRYFGIQKE